MQICIFIRSPSQSQDDQDNFELNIDTATAHNPFLTVVLGDFNTISNLWFKGDKTTYESSKIGGITSTFGLQQITNELTHIIGDSSSCIDLIYFTTKFSDGVRDALLIISKLPSSDNFNLKIHYTPPYEQKIWHYEKANVDHIKGSIHEFSWERCFANTSVNDKVNIFNKIIKNIISNYIPHETITWDDRDPPWINKDMK